MSRLVLLGTSLIFLVCAMSIPSLAGERWHCESKGVSQLTKGHNSDTEIEIDGASLRQTTKLPSFLEKSEFHPWVFRILENNNVGIVAASSQATMVPGGGPAVGAVITTIDRSSGAFRVITTGADSPTDLWKGHCTLK
jgi:hypothetical protein